MLTHPPDQLLGFHLLFSPPPDGFALLPSHAPAASIEEKQWTQQLAKNGGHAPLAGTLGTAPCSCMPLQMHCQAPQPTERAEPRPLATSCCGAPQQRHAKLLKGKMYTTSCRAHRSSAMPNCSTGMAAYASRSASGGSCSRSSLHKGSLKGQQQGSKHRSIAAAAAAALRSVAATGTNAAENSSTAAAKCLLEFGCIAVSRHRRRLRVLLPPLLAVGMGCRLALGWPGSNVQAVGHLLGERWVAGNPTVLKPWSCSFPASA